jgi:hypothetical protein
MILGMFSRLFYGLFLLVALNGSALAQGSNVTIDTDMRLFTTMAALNAAGFDVEYGAEYHPVREIVREYAKDLDPDFLARLKEFYRSRKGTQTDEEQLPKYISLAINLTDPPEFKPAGREEYIPPDARSVIGFADLLREFYIKAKIAQRWIDVRARYQTAIARIAPTLRDMIVRRLIAPDGCLSGTGCSGEHRERSKQPGQLLCRPGRCDKSQARRHPPRVSSFPAR